LIEKSQFHQLTRKKANKRRALVKSPVSVEKVPQLMLVGGAKFTL